MASFILTPGNYSAQTLLDGESGFVGQGAIISEIGTVGVTGGATNAVIVSLTVHGQIAVLDTEAVQLEAAQIYMTVGETAVISSQTPGQLRAGVVMDAGLYASLINDGMISGASTGLELALLNANSRSLIVNDGTIQGADYGIYVSGLELQSSVVIQNSGSIIGSGGGIISLEGATVAFSIYNSGLIGAALLGESAAIFTEGGNDLLQNTGQILGGIFTSGGEDRVVNRGLIEGDVTTGLNNDLIDTSRGEVTGDLLTEAGNDQLFLNPGLGETANGGAGIDTVIYSGPLGAVYALDGSFEAAGAAEGDTLLSIERLTGTVASADILRGNNGVNVLSGRGGADQLDGARGADSLAGGQGIDTLIGGHGNDLFIFDRIADLGDVITDFTNRAGNNDRMQFAGAAFGLAAYTGVGPPGLLPIFQSRADNLAQDADDRFIFRTTDRSLWFDADGNGAGTAVMVADLQDGATFTASDIVIL